MLARCIYRATLRASSAVRDSGRALLLSPPVSGDEWGTHRRMTAQDLDALREQVFPWASAGDTAAEAGALSATVS